MFVDKGTQRLAVKNDATSKDGIVAKKAYSSRSITRLSVAFVVQWFWGYSILLQQGFCVTFSVEFNNVHTNSCINVNNVLCCRYMALTGNLGYNGAVRCKDRFEKKPHMHTRDSFRPQYALRFAYQLSVWLRHIMYRNVHSGGRIVKEITWFKRYLMLQWTTHRYWFMWDI